MKTKMEAELSRPIGQSGWLGKMNTNAHNARIDKSLSHGGTHTILYKDNKGWSSSQTVHADNGLAWTIRNARGLGQHYRVEWCVIRAIDGVAIAQSRGY